MFTEADALVINKVDVLPHFEFDLARFRKAVKGLNPKVKVFEVSCKTGIGIDAWCGWILTEAKKLRKA
jgi:hydrogenase nickel incorporation protein HypB